VFPSGCDPTPTVYHSRVPGNLKAGALIALFTTQKS